jgi:hypothetical protein
MTHQPKKNFGIMLYVEGIQPWSTVYASSDSIHNITSALAVYMVDRIISGMAEKYGFDGILVFETSKDPDIMTLDMLVQLKAVKCTYVSVTRRKTFFPQLHYEINPDVLQKNFGSNDALKIIADIASRSVKQIKEDYKKHGGKWSWFTSHNSRMMFVMRSCLVSHANKNKMSDASS